MCSDPEEEGTATEKRLYLFRSVRQRDGAGREANAPNSATFSLKADDMSQSKILLEVGTNELEIVEFFINEEGGYRGYYGINVSKVVEIIRQQPVTAMPQMRHPCVKGAFPN